MTGRKSRETRRGFVQQVGAGVLAGGVAGLAGCTSGENSGDGGGGGGGGNGDGNGSGGGTTGGGGGSQTLKLGGLFATSGPYSALGVDQRDGVKVALQHIEEEGVDLTVEETFADTQLNPEEGLRRARELVERESVDALIGIASSSVAAAVANYANQNQVPLMLTVATDEALTGEKCNKFTFRSNTHTYQNQKPNAEYAMENLGTTFATMGADYSWGRASVKAFVEVAEANGGEVVEQVWPKLGASDYSSEIQKVADSDAEFLLVRCSGADGVKSAKQIASFGLKEQMDIITNQTTIVAQGAGDAAVGNYGGVPYHAALTSEQTGNDQNEKFVADYREIGDGSDPSTYSCSSYMGMWFLGKAVVEAGSTDGAAMVDALEGISHDGPKGPMEIRACDHQATNAVWSSQLVSPEGTEFDYPIPKIFKKHDSGTNSRPCEETGCNL
ncbi:ABC transporter substrate-binding protein [Halomarina litorea]|uniref:ABC transporter substrate-binding protein n=1 Tax=Halomarina litorea TaxID=2961595 RepID=UPI0020C32A79|nr:ABC transporter substrate-binding protein [Halomarina sp. BCD28]